MLDLTPHHLRFDVLIETYWNVKAAEEVSEPIRLKY